MIHEISQIPNQQSFKERCQFDVPRIEGKIDGKEIHEKPGYYSYVGSITVHGKEMVVKLSADNYDFHRLDRVEWNGTYTLVEKK